ncbi:MAG: PQQ-binding-like beta-propeller repeat protein, partial [candidate division Zixibacteria bacterium]|nr:PQQ-binding-like beta-propeller repeat protein [candidate division Zixibacteria bacterium]
PLTIGAGNLIYCGSKGRIHFFDLETGARRGRQKNSSGVQTGVIVVDSLAYLGVGPPRNRFVCLNLYNQRTIWTIPLKDVVGPPIIIEDRLYVGSDSGRVFCLSRLTGEIVWDHQAKAKSIAGPSYDDGIVYWPFEDGNFCAYEILEGKMVFQIDMKQPLVSKAAIGDRIYLADLGGGFSALDKKTGRLIWQKEFPWPIWTSPSVDDSMVFVGDNGGFIRALNKNDGHTMWEFKSDGVIISSPVVVGNYLLIASLDRNIYCIEKRTGLLVSKRQMKHEVRYPAISDGRRIFLMAQDGTLQCFED